MDAIRYDLSRALQTAPALKDLSIQAGNVFHGWLQEGYLEILITNPRLERVTVYGRSQRRIFQEHAARKLSSSQTDMFKFKRCEMEQKM